MASKRFRIVPSSSQGEVGLYTNIQPLELPIAPWGQKCRQHTQPPPKNSNQAPVAASKRPRRPNIKLLEQQPQPRQGIFTLNSPIGETNDFVSKEPPDEGFRAFLECCSLCNKKLRQDKDVYMYGYLTAFCSPECRNDQMALDGFNKKNDAERKTKKMAFFGKSNAAKQ